MDINRHQYFLIGLVLLFLGIQFRAVESFQLNTDLTQFLAKRRAEPLAAVNNTTQALVPSAEPVLTKTVRPPDWIGWAMLSLGVTLILHSMAMKRPD